MRRIVNIFLPVCCFPPVRKHFTHIETLPFLVKGCKSLSICFTPPNLINIQGHELEGAFIFHALTCLEIHGQIKYVPTYSLFQFLKESLTLLYKVGIKNLS